MCVRINIEEILREINNLMIWLKKKNIIMVWEKVRIFIWIL